MFILNAFSVSMIPQGGEVEFTNLGTVEEVLGCLTKKDGTMGFTSAIGHEGTAAVFSRLLGIALPANRIQVTLQPGDCAIVGSINARLPEGKVLSEAELAGLPIRWVLVHVKNG